jgi:hypothetical protein
MSLQSISPTTRIEFPPVVFSSISVLILTSIHHAYGAYIYNTVWRLDVVVASAAGALVIALCFWAASRHADQMSGRIALWLGLIVVAGLPVVAIGLFEGGYNHVLKNLVYFLASPETYRQMFPATTYEIPTNWIFEGTGIAQFPLALLAAWHASWLLGRKR